MCASAPESITGLQAKHTYHAENLYDLQIYWDKPLQEPDNYTLEIDLHGDDDQVYVLLVPGVSLINSSITKIR